MSQLLLPSLIFSLLVVGLVWISWGEFRPLVLGLGLFCLGYFGLWLSPVALVQVLLTCVLLVVCRIAGKSLRAARATAILALLAAYAFGWMQVQSERRTLARLREMFPLQSMSHRLAYETRPRSARIGATVDSTSTEPEPQLAASVEEALSRAETDPSHGYRSSTLKSLHDLAYAEFEILAGFGPGRMVPLRRRVTRVALPEPRTISLSDPPSQPGCDDRQPEYKPIPSPIFTPEPFFSPSGDSPSPSYALRQTHRHGADDFLNPQRFGYVQDREHVAGFVPHGFDDVPRIPNVAGGRSEWRIERLELVSLLKPTGPVAYVSERLPRADEAGRYDTRLLDDFETRALGRLQTEDDVVIETVDEKLRMLGALRAGNHCLQCHSVRRGELIGAFTYELEREVRPPVRQTAVVEPPQT